MMRASSAGYITEPANVSVTLSVYDVVSPSAMHVLNYFCWKYLTDRWFYNALTGYLCSGDMGGGGAGGGGWREGGVNQL